MPSDDLPNPLASAPKVVRFKAALDFIDRVTRDGGRLQEELLSSILSRNSATEYLCGLGLNGGSNDCRTFKKLAPLVNYEDIQPLIKRIVNGDKSSILSCHPVSEFLTSSGTSGGERKLMPTIEEDHERRALIYSLLTPVMSQYLDGVDEGKGLYFMFVKSETTTPSGLLARPVLTSYYKSEWFRRQANRDGDRYTSPLQAVLCLDVSQSMYCQLLSGLVQRKEVSKVGAVFASTIIRALHFLEERWPEIVQDIRERKLTGSIVTDADLRDMMEAMLASCGGAGPEAAEEIAMECRRDNWKGIIRQLWPRAKCLDAIVTGSMAQYVPTLEFYSGGLPLMSLLYASSESYFGLNLTPLCSPSSISYTLIPVMAYFEFLPLSDEPSASNLVDLAHVEMGKEYEIVITTYGGCYRYRVGDVLRVSGYYNSAPKFQFVCRRNVALSIDADKTDEETLHRAVMAATSHHLDAFSYRLLEYTSFADLSTVPGHYVLFWELRHRADKISAASCDTETAHAQDCSTQVRTSLPLIDTSLMEACCLAMEESLDSVYRQCRVCDKSIGPLEIRVVSANTFDALMEYCVAQGASISQYKTPRCVKHAPLIDLLNSRVSHSVFSPKCPSWSPASVVASVS
ncbi:hypothetical protein KP509_1Z008800 [Ceratopteris richardii]|nr:hypothetical protein KP509_1Z008800 [Ceratopteris richardii]